MAAFLFDFTCSNRTVWGAEGYQEIRIRHTSGAPDSWIEEAMPAIEAYREQSTVGLVESIKKAQQKRIENVDEFLLKRFSKPQVSAIKAAHMEDEQRPIESLWDVATGVTAYARAIQYQDQRVDLEREAGKILNLAA
jgi:DNA polymerase II small subunit/DNA polymerase delta subunit B